MAKKNLTLVYVAGAAGLAYMILRKPAPALPAYQQQPAQASPLALLSQGVTAISNLFKTPAPALLPENVVDNPNQTSVYEPPTYVPPVTAPAAPIYVAPLELSQAAMSGFYEVPGTALAVIGACASCFMKPTLGIGKTGFDWTKLIVPGVVIAGGYLLVKNLGLLDGASATNNSAIASQTANANQSALQQATAQGSSTTMSTAQYNSLATDIFNQGQSFTGIVSSRAMDQIALDIQQCKTIADLLSLKIAFGVKQLPASFWSSCQWLNINCTAMDLDAFIKLNLDAGHLAQINSYLQGQGISYQF